MRRGKSIQDNPEIINTKKEVYEKEFLALIALLGIYFLTLIMVSIKAFF